MHQGAAVEEAQLHPLALADRLISPFVDSCQTGLGQSLHAELPPPFHPHDASPFVSLG